MTQNKIALAVGAHPDDIEFLCTGTLALLRAKGWEIHIATMTPGDCGSETLDAEEISAIRRVEAANAAAVLGGTYHCLECRDGLIAYDAETIFKTVALVRKVRPSLVFALSPQDYMIDHEVASALMRNAVFMAGVPRWKTEPYPPFRPVPHLYYVDPLELVDIYGTTIVPTTVVDITTAMDTKKQMIVCHASQRDWIRHQHGVDEYLNIMYDLGRRRGKLIGTEFAEGFRQHLGHSYPQDNLLAAELGETVHLNQNS
jgi:LmbE family N-acetylglucosaminyl deacetylase